MIVFMLAIGVWLGRSVLERVLLIASCLLVIITELLNSAVEAAVDRIGTEHHELSKRATDMVPAMLEGKLKGLYVIGGNSKLSNPDWNYLSHALKKLDFLVVQELFLSDCPSGRRGLFGCFRG